MFAKRWHALVVTLGLIHIHNAKSTDNQQAAQSASETLHSLYAPLVFYPGSITRFFEQVFNRPEYAQNVVPNDLSHFTQCFEYIHKKYKKNRYAKHILRIFTHKLRAAPYVNATAYITMLDQLTPQVRELLDGSTDKLHAAWKISINDVLYSTFFDHFEQFKASPQKFFEHIAGNITTTLANPGDVVDDVTAEEFQHYFVKFLDLGMGKLMWSAHDELKTWDYTKQIAERLGFLAQEGLISDDDLYDLRDTLFERYCFILDVAAGDFKPSFFTDLRDTINGTTVALLDDDAELETCLETRRQRMAGVLRDGYARSKARMAGLRMRA